MFLVSYMDQGCANTAAAARRAGYNGSPATLRAVGGELLRRPHVRRALDSVLATMAMTKAEVLHHISEIVRDSTIENMTVVNAKGKRVFSLEAAISNGVGHLIKELKTGPQGLKLKPYDRLEALKLLASIHGMTLSKSVSLSLTAEDLAKMDEDQLRQLADGKVPDGYRR